MNKTHPIVWETPEINKEAYSGNTSTISLA